MSTPFVDSKDGPVEKELLSDALVIGFINVCRWFLRIIIGGGVFMFTDVLLLLGVTSVVKTTLWTLVFTVENVRLIHLALVLSC